MAEACSLKLKRWELSEWVECDRARNYAVLRYDGGWQGPSGLGDSQVSQAHICVIVTSHTIYNYVSAMYGQSALNTRK